MTGASSEFDAAIIMTADDAVVQGARAQLSGMTTGERHDLLKYLCGEHKVEFLVAVHFRAAVGYG